MRALTDKQNGIALVLVLWATTLLTVIAGGFVYSVRTDTQLANNLVLSARVQALADGGVHRALFEMNKPVYTIGRWMSNGGKNRIKVDDAILTIQIMDVSGKIDLNTGNDELIKGLFLSYGLEDAYSSAMLSAIKDWRDIDDQPQTNGAEASHYRSAGLTYVPPNRPFQVVAELQRVLGMTPELYDELKDALTVNSRQRGIDTTIASKKVLLAIPGSDEEMVDNYIQQREEALAKNFAPLPFPLDSFGMATNFTSVYSVRAEASLPGGATFVREAIVELNPRANRKVTFLSWTEGRRL
jgi:general secretion pathway protein K